MASTIGDWTPDQLIRFLTQRHRPKASEVETVSAGKLLRVEDELSLGPRATDYIKGLATQAIDLSPFTSLTWTAVTFLNSWVNLSAGTWEAAAYAKAPNGVVFIRGVVASGAVGNPIFQLPVGFRPAVGQIFNVGVETTDGNNADARLDIGTNGNVTPVRQAANGSASAYTSLCGLWFRT